MTTPRKTNATGRIEVKTYEPQPYEEVDEGPNLLEIHVSETFSGDIEGEGVVRFLQAVRKDGSASFVGIERVTGSLEGRTGSFRFKTSARSKVTRSRETGSWFPAPAPAS